MNPAEIASHLELAKEELDTATVVQNEKHPLDKLRLDDAVRHYNTILKRYHIKKTEKISNILRNHYLSL